MASRKPTRPSSSARAPSAKKPKAPARRADPTPVLPVPPPSGLTHIDPHGRVRMVDVTEKAETERSATARATLSCSAATRNAILGGDLRKGEALAAARIAGILAAKRTGELIPLCHPLSLTDVEITFLPLSKGVTIQAKATTLGRTGVEMEALVAASVAALTLYDMAKAVEREMVIGNVMLMEKRGGKSGDWERPKR